MNLCHWTGQHILVNKEEICILALTDAASLILDEHLLGAVDGQSSECLLASQEFFRPPGFRLLRVIYTCHLVLRGVRSAVQAATRLWRDAKAYLR